MSDFKRPLPTNWVTLYTDASHKNSMCSYAFYARSPWGVFKRGRACPEVIAGVDDAEMYAIYQGVGQCVRKWQKNVGGFWIRTDSISVMGILKQAKKPASTNQERMLHAFNKLVYEHQLGINIKHVKGHQPQNANVQAWLNNEVDRMAGHARRSHFKT